MRWRRDPLFHGFGLGQPLVQTRTDVVRGVGVSLALIARDENAARYYAGDTSHTDPLPDASHDQILPKLRW